MNYTVKSEDSMKRFIKAVFVTVAIFMLTSCSEKTNGRGMSEVPQDTVGQSTVQITTGETQPSNEEQSVLEALHAQPQISETQYGNTNANISNGAFTVLDGNNIYFVLPINKDYDVALGDLIKTNADGNERTVLSSGDRFSYLNYVSGWIYYINSLDGKIYKMRDDGTETALIVSADSQSDYYQGHTTQHLGTVEAMAIVDNYIYYRVRVPSVQSFSGYIKEIYRTNIDSGEVELLQQLGALTSGFTVYNGWIYYSINDANKSGAWEAYRIRTDGTENAKIADIQLYSTSIENDKIFYISDDESNIYSMDLDGANNKLFGDGIIAAKINVACGWIYFANRSAIYKIRTNGTEITKLCNIPNYNSIDINVLNDWIFLMGNGKNMLMVKTDGSDFQEVR